MEAIPITGDELTPIYNGLVAQMGDPVLIGHNFAKLLGREQERPKRKSRHKKLDNVDDVT